MDTPITRAEHEEFRRRMEDEHKRMNHRLGDLEETVRQIGKQKEIAYGHTYYQGGA